jgi:hypothetical protein
MVLAVHTSARQGLYLIEIAIGIGIGIEFFTSFDKASPNN